MPSDDYKIRPLPLGVAAKIKSSTSITHLNGVIVELVKNALDGNARTIFVTVDFQRGGCIVEDDGDGIPPAEFESDGGLGKAHHTSKLRSEKVVHGQQGLFLASLASLSLLTVTSHHFRHNSTNSVVFHHSTAIARLTPAPATHHLRFSGHGTRVTVNDLFGNMPVRVKSRALALQKADESERQWDDLRQLLVSLMLANDDLTKLVISTAGNERKLTIRSHVGSQRSTGETDIHRIASILTQAGLLEQQNANQWEPVSACVSGISVHAAISLVPSPTKKVQFISIGIGPVYPRNSMDLLYTEINRLFALSDYGTDGRPAFSSHGNASPRIAGKAVNRWPMFYIRIDIDHPRKFYDSAHEVAPESDQSIRRIIDVLAAMIIEFLKQHGLRPRAGRRKKSAQSLSNTELSDTNEAPRAQSPRLHGSAEEALGCRLKIPFFRRDLSRGIGADFTNWPRVKSAKEPFTATHGSYVGLKKAHPSFSEANKEVPPSPKTDDNLVDKNVDPCEENKSDVDTMIPWVDPYTGRTHWINSRTGQSINVKTSLPATFNGERPQSTGTIQTLRGVDQPRPTTLSGSHNIWVEDLLRRWENPAYGRPEKPMNAISDGKSFGTIRNYDDSGELCGFEDFGLAKFRGKLRKQDLEMAEIIAQVDRKFILAKVASGRGSRSSLILIDQHAADERCRVENLFGELFAVSDDGHGEVQTIRIDPIAFEVPLIEASLFGKYANFFASWGVGYNVEQRAGGRTTVRVDYLPTLIAERCRVETSLVTDLIRSEIWRLEEDGERSAAVVSRRGLRCASSFDNPTTKNEDTWVERLKSCPRGIIDLLNSRACRTAIMFNDVLTIDECQSVVTRLSRCVLPFQCAHGRPSMVPIVDLREMDESALLGDEGCEYEMKADFVEAFRSWQVGEE